MTYYNPDLFWLCTQTTWLRKTRLISKFLTSQTKTEITTLHILHNISRSKGHQTRTFFQFIEYRMRNIFLEKWQKGGSKNRCFKKTKPVNFSEKNEHFLPPDTHIYECVWRVFSCEIWEIFNVFFHRTPPVAVSGSNHYFAQCALHYWNT